MIRASAGTSGSQSKGEWDWDDDQYLIKDIRDLVADSKPQEQTKQRPSEGNVLRQNASQPNQDEHHISQISIKSGRRLSVEAQ